MKNRTAAWNLQQINLVNHLYKAVSVAKKYYPSSNFVSIPEDVLHPSTKKNIYSRPNLKIAEQPIAILSFYSINFQNCRTTSLMTPASTRALSIKSSAKGLNAHLNVILLLLHSLMKSRISWIGEDDTFQDLSRHRRIMSMCIGQNLPFSPLIFSSPESHSFLGLFFLWLHPFKDSTLHGKPAPNDLARLKSLILLCSYLCDI